jgi:YbbR domain-containing protein
VVVHSLAQPVKIVSRTPQTVTINLEQVVKKDIPIRLIRRGEPAIGYQADDVSLGQQTVQVSGPASVVQNVAEARVLLDIAQASDTINRSIPVEIVDANEVPVAGVTVTPAQVIVEQPISQRGGYRNVVVKVVTSTGSSVGSGYRLTSMSVFPPTVTVFSSNPSLIDSLPGFVETSPLDLTGVREDIDLPLPLNLPDGVEVVGEQTVLVQLSVSAIEGSITLSNLPVEIVGLPTNLVARISPTTVDAIISGPVPLLERLTEEDVRVSLDLSEVEAGTYQFAPRVTLSIQELKIESILPGSIEVVVDLRSRVTPTFTPTPTPTPRPTLPFFTPTPG